MNKKKRLPAYQSVANELRSDIQSGKYAAGQLLPPEGKLEELYEVSRTTIRHAIQVLAQEGLLRVQQGYGTEVLSQKPYRRFTDVRSFEEVILCNLDDFELYDMSIEETTMDMEIAAQLGYPVGSPVYRIQRLTGFKDVPFQIMVNYIPCELAPGLNRFSGQFVTLYPLLQTEYGIEFKSADEEVSAKPADMFESKLLHINVGAPVFKLARVARCNRGILEASYLTIRADLYKLRIGMDVIHSNQT